MRQWLLAHWHAFPFRNDDLAILPLRPLHVNWQQQQGANPSNRALQALRSIPARKLGTSSVSSPVSLLWLRRRGSSTSLYLLWCLVPPRRPLFFFFFFFSPDASCPECLCFLASRCCELWCPGGKPLGSAGRLLSRGGSSSATSSLLMCSLISSSPEYPSRRQASSSSSDSS